MIHVDRPTTAPGVLLKKGIPQTEEDCTLYGAAPEDYSEGSQKFEFKQRIYAHPSVKCTSSAKVGPSGPQVKRQFEPMLIGLV